LEAHLYPRSAALGILYAALGSERARLSSNHTMSQKLSLWKFELKEIGAYLELSVALLHI